ncbi:MAG: hypothetical protein A2831_02100 [Candidatus Yanofskybacteria bacterium RIFCSPHIGHO2_01_FULL_44_17]|uniref:Lon N-terminal domain-containing protein n=1 Tax=Candidatus Yanofskybacteria bacterium RIFCSPHIGHO2_01_FULL_44_17 TaxID=1802668 RepID=A0A1F8ES05_9BACT|nr:MAG: hypothetical protein A2831_02100 [Candidatus Yanofskybacteria bacterium RIFCSPHIGHO2_01_FULL_44_17]
MPEPQDKADLRLPIISFSGHSIFPQTFFLLKPEPKSRTAKLIGRVLKSLPPKCLVVVQDSGHRYDDPDGISAVGVVTKLFSQEDRVKFSAEYRAGLSNLVYEPGEQMWSARVTRLRDEPEEKGLDIGNSELPMILGCIESIYYLFLEIKGLERDPDLLEKINGYIEKLKLNRREKETAYYLPWHILIDFRHLPEDIKRWALRTDSVVERLQIIVDALKAEKSILSHAIMLAEDDPDVTPKDESN